MSVWQTVGVGLNSLRIKIEEWYHDDEENDDTAETTCVEFTFRGSARRLKEVEDWCHENLIGEWEWKSMAGRVCSLTLNEEADWMAFKLRWM